MMQIILLILKIIGITLAAVIGLLLLVVAAVLFVPVLIEEELYLKLILLISLCVALGKGQQ